MIASFKDGLNILSKLTFSRLINAGKVYSGYYYSKLLKKPVASGLPIAISIEPTTSCNLRCPECPSGLRSFTRPTGMLTEEVFKKAIDELQSKLLYLTFYFQGEPYLNPKFLDLVAYAASKKIYTATSTNAHYLNDENAKRTVTSGLDRLIISIDGTTQETYESYRVGGSLQKVLEGTENILRWKKQLKSQTPYVIFQFLVVKPNEHQIPEVKALAEKMGVDKVVFKTAQIYNYEQGSPLIPNQEKFSRYRQKQDGTYEIKNKLTNSCWKMWHSCVITWDGKVVPCCFDKDASHPLGDITTQSFKSIWKSRKYIHFRKALLRSRNEIDICRNCTEGTKVWG
ncbi:MAG TPA: SPASM domain-containing protein [Cytophagaceae bacterium]